MPGKIASTAFFYACTPHRKKSAPQYFKKGESMNWSKYYEDRKSQAVVQCNGRSADADVAASAPRHGQPFTPSDLEAIFPMNIFETKCPATLDRHSEEGLQKYLLWAPYPPLHARAFQKLLAARADYYKHDGVSRPAPTTQRGLSQGLLQFDGGTKSFTTEPAQGVGLRRAMACQMFGLHAGFSGEGQLCANPYRRMLMYTWGEDARSPAN
jgi:predicted alternative tryptophan synthase beta-subunit